MNSAQEDFQKAWKKLVSQGEPCTTKSFIPLGIRKDVKETGPLYHGTKANVSIGDFIKPGYPSNYGKRKTANFVYVTAIQDGAILAAELAIGQGNGRIYIVEPTGNIEDDPNVTDQKFPGNPSRSYRTKEPVRVIGEVKDWEHYPAEALQKIREHIQATEKLGIEAINE